MEVSRIRALRGPNLWSRHTAIEAIVTLDEVERSLETLPGFEDRLRARFPELGILRATRHFDAVGLAHALEFAALCLQAQAGCPVTFSRAAETVESGVYQIVVEYSEEPVGKLALALAEKLCRAALDDQPFDLADALHQLRELDEDVRLGPSTGSIVEAAVLRGVPYRRLTEGSLVQFGWGSKQRRIQAAEVDWTSAIAESIAQDKDLTKKLLRAAGVPVPEGRPVFSAEDAWAAAQEIGAETVDVDRRDIDMGVTVNLREREEIMRAYEVAHGFRDEVLVERFLPGGDFRLLVVGDKLVAAARREPPNVIGDGVHTVRELVEQVNADPRRGEGHATSLTKIRFDAIAISTLEKQGMNADSVPEKGKRVVLRNNANLSTGGSATDVTDDVHPEVAARAVAAAQMVGLDICGVDVVCDTVLRPLEEQGGGMVELNA
ncbi:MAG TPA: cyanophycin synthetase, partial [Rhodocyclaceae bacterium]|nr:cyanophycin synthetase [Rhodocyclaceae bacterium]